MTTNDQVETLAKYFESQLELMEVRIHRLENKPQFRPGMHVKYKRSNKVLECSIIGYFYEDDLAKEPIYRLVAPNFEYIETIGEKISL